jgi:hypothetical protein
VGAELEEELEGKLPPLSLLTLLVLVVVFFLKIVAQKVIATLLLSPFSLFFVAAE